MATTLQFDLLPWQREVMESKARFRVVVAGRRCGKSRFAIIQTLISALQCKSPDASVVYIAPTIAMVKVLAWDALMQLGKPVIASSNVNEGKIKLLNGVSIYCRGADNPDTLRGMKMAYAVLDETKDLKDNIFEMIVRPALSDLQGGALIIGTPSPDATQFRSYYDLGQNDESGEWGSWHKTTADNPLIPRSEIEAAKRTLSTVAFEQEYMASFDTTGANILRLEWFKTAEAPAGDYSTYIAIDPAGYEGVADGDRKKKHLDFFAIAVVRVYGNGHWWVQKIDYGRWDVREAAVRVLMAIRTHKPMCVGTESGALSKALMPYLTDLMRKNNVYAHIEYISHGGQNKANRITYALQGLLEHGRITFNLKENWDELKREMLSFPSVRAHDDCFPADAPIITLDGIKPIVDITTDDYVLTRNGFRRVLKAWCKGTRKVITRYGITATPDHRIFTKNKGWVSLDSLCDGDTILVCKPIKETSCEKQSSLMDGSTTVIQTQSNQTIGDITHPIVSGKQLQDHCIETSGSSITEQSQKDTTSIMQTETSTTTTSQILPACQVPRTKLSIGKSVAKEENQKDSSSTWKISETLLKHGTLLQKEWNGIDNTHCNQSCNEICQKNHVLFAGNNSNQKSKKHQCVVTNVKDNEQINCNVKDGFVPVYDLMVENDHEFFAYGMLVHNCIDALAYIAHLSVTTYQDAEDNAGDEYEPLDIISGI